MIRHVVRSLVSGVVLLFVVTAVVFALIYSSGTSVARNILGQSASAEQVAELNSRLGLDRPIHLQYFDWLGNAARGDLGVSYFTQEPIMTALTSRLPITFSVVLVAVLLTIVLSVALGIAAASRGGWLDRIIQGVSTVSYVFPPLILAIGLVYLFAIVLRWVPAIGYMAFAQNPVGWLASVSLPAIALAIAGVATLAAQIRGSVLDELGRDYVRTLRSRGVSERSILYKHVLRNAAAPALTVFSVLFIGLFSASFFVERIYALPGFGNFAMNASIQGDLPALMGVTLFSVVLVVIVNIVADVLQGWLNPKVRAR